MKNEGVLDNGKAMCSCCTNSAEAFDELTQKYFCFREDCLRQIHFSSRHVYWPLISRSYEDVTGSVLTVSKYLELAERIKSIHEEHGSSEFGAELFNPLSPLAPNRLRRRRVYELLDNGSKIYVLWGSNRGILTLVNVYSEAQIKVIRNIYSVSPLLKERESHCPHFYVGRDYKCFECGKSLMVIEQVESIDDTALSGRWIQLSTHAIKRFKQRFPHLKMKDELYTLERCPKQIVSAIRNAVSADTLKRHKFKQVQYYQSANDAIFVIAEVNKRLVCLTVLWNPLIDLYQAFDVP